MITLNQLRETIDRMIARAAHVGGKEVKVRSPEGNLCTLESCELAADTGAHHVELVIRSPEAPHGLCETDSEEVPEAADDLLAEDGQ